MSNKSTGELLQCETKTRKKRPDCYLLLERQHEREFSLYVCVSVSAKNTQEAQLPQSKRASDITLSYCA